MAIASVNDDPSENSVKTFFPGANAMLKSIREVRQLYNREMAFEFDPFSQFWWPGENKTSEILRFFLDPNETHAQGDTYLNLFWEKIERNDLIQLAENKTISVECEVRTKENRKIDIVITIGKDDFIIGIENKIYTWTHDQKDQLKDYNEDLKRRNSKKYLLLYLAPKGKEPSEYSLPKDLRDTLEKKSETEGTTLFKIINYEEDIIPCIDKWVMHSQPIRVKSFLQDFKQYLNLKYKGEKFMDEQRKIVEYATSSKENIDVALATASSIEDIRIELLKKLKAQLIAFAKEKELKADEEDEGNPWGLGGKDSGFKFDLPKSKYGSFIALEFDEGRHGFFVGVRIDHKYLPLLGGFEGEEYKRLQNTVSEKLNFIPGPRIQNFENWLYAYYYNDGWKDWDNNRDIWIGIPDETTAKKLIKTVFEILQNLEGIEL